MCLARLSIEAMWIIASELAFRYIADTYRGARKLGTFRAVEIAEELRISLTNANSRNQASPRSRSAQA
jgi:hypothetical protein